MEDRWTKMAVLSSVNEEAIDLLDTLLDSSLGHSPEGQEFLRKLTFLVAARDQSLGARADVKPIPKN